MVFHCTSNLHEKKVCFGLSLDLSEFKLCIVALLCALSKESNILSILIIFRGNAELKTKSIPAILFRLILRYLSPIGRQCRS